MLLLDIMAALAQVRLPVMTPDTFARQAFLLQLSVLLTSSVPKASASLSRRTFFL
jgi:hypothetical protein